MPLQRSTHEAAVDIPAIPATVQPGVTVDWPDPIAGFVLVDDPPSPPADEPRPASKKKPAIAEEVAS
ncbi:hypothetical protein CTZ27_33365 [Streptomyces griseocarneus]|nr:hypothetical protein CTZ27_33365 [Streptomyces griseocarneus]